MEGTPARLYERDVMLARLRTVSDDDYLKERFYPLLLKHAGDDKAAIGVLMMFTLAVSDYASGLHPVAAPAIQLAVVEKIPEFIDAVVVDPEAAEVVKKLHTKVQEEARNRSS